MRRIGMVCAMGLAAFAWAPAVGAQQNASSQQPGTRAGGGSSVIEDSIVVRLAEKAWIGGDFQVSANDGMVTLAGTVPSEATKARIGRIARQTIGVREVRNELRVNPGVANSGSPVNDAELAQRVARQIASQIAGAKSGEDWWFEGWRVEGPDNGWNFVVEAESGRIYLDGDVPRLSIMRTAIDAARKTSGVQSVRSDLELDRVYHARGVYGPYGGYPYPAPYAYDVGDGVDVTPGTASRQSPGITGQVTSIDRERGRLTLQTASGSEQISMPPSALVGIQQGQQVTVQVQRVDGSPAASPPGSEQRRTTGQGRTKGNQN